MARCSQLVVVVVVVVSAALLQPAPAGASPTRPHQVSFRGKRNDWDGIINVFNDFCLELMYNCTNTKLYCCGDLVCTKYIDRPGEKVIWACLKKK